MKQSHNKHREVLEAASPPPHLPDSRSNHERKMIRLSLDISLELNDVLERIANETGTSKTDILRKAISLMEVAVNAKREGKKFGIAEKHQQLATEIIGI